MKQSPRQWNKRFRRFLKKFNFVPSKSDHCVYCGLINDEAVILALYVDDGLLFAQTDRAIGKVVEYLRDEFNITIGKEDLFVGLEIRQSSEGNVKITQKEYLTRVINRFGMTDAKGSATPAQLNNSLVVSSDDKNEQLMKTIPYREAVGSLMFAAVASRPDIMYAVANVSRFMSNPSLEHWQAVKMILRYIKDTLNVGIEYHSVGEVQLTGYSDSDYARDLNTRRSTSGIIFTLASGLISWSKTVCCSNVNH